MWRFVLVAAALLWGSIAHSQLTTTLAGGGKGQGTDPATTAWVAQVVTNGGTVSAPRQIVVNALIAGLKGDNIWTKLDRLGILAAENSQSALTDMKGLTLAVANGAPAFVVDRGYTGVDASATVYIETGTNLSTYGGQYGTNAGHVSAWSNSNLTSGVSGGALLGLTTSNANSTQIDAKYNDGKAYFFVNDGVTSAGVANASALGHYLGNRSGAALTQGYINGTLALSPNSTAGTIPNGTLTVLAQRDTIAGIIAGTALQISMWSLGANLSATDVTNFYNRLRTYMTAVGVP